MGYKFNPFTGKFDQVGDAAETSPSVFTVLDEIRVTEDAELSLEENAEVLVKDTGSSNAQKIIMIVTIRSNGELLIENNSAVEVLNE